MSFIENESATFEDLCLRLERDFPGSPAAAMLHRFYGWRRYTLTLQSEADGLREALAVHEKRTAFMRKISPHVAAMLDEYDAPVAAVLSEGCGSPQDRSSEEKQ